MDQQFKSSFIPRKDITIATRGEGGISGHSERGIVDHICAFIFVVTLLAWGGLFGWQKYVEASITDVEKKIVEARARIDSSKVDQFRALGKQIQISKDLLNKHVVASPVFDIIEPLTVPSVQFTDFALELVPTGLQVLSKARAGNFAAVELQEQALAGSAQLEGVEVSDISLAEENGEISFSVAFIVPRNQVLYGEIVKPEPVVAPEVTAPAAPAGTPTSAPSAGAGGQSAPQPPAPPPPQPPPAPAAPVVEPDIPPEDIIIEDEFDDLFDQFEDIDS